MAGRRPVVVVVSWRGLDGMSGYSDYFAWLADGGWIRVSARAVIFDAGRERILVERNASLGSTFFNFIGGGVEVGETLVACLARELAEETNARIAAATYLFVVENFIPHGTETRHSLEHYFELALDVEAVAPVVEGVELVWVPVADLGRVDLRPGVVRDCIREGRVGEVRYLVRR